MDIKLEKGNTYNITVKYGNAIGGYIFNNLKLIGEFLGPDIIRATVDPDIDITWFNIQTEASPDDVIKRLNIKDLTFYVFIDIENNKRVIAKEWISTYSGSGNDYSFIVRNVTVEQKMVIVRTLKNLGLNVEEIHNGVIPLSNTNDIEEEDEND